MKERDPDLELLKSNFRIPDPELNKLRIVEIVDAYIANGRNFLKTRTFLEAHFKQQEEVKKQEKSASDIKFKETVAMLVMTFDLEKVII